MTICPSVIVIEPSDSPFRLKHCSRAVFLRLDATGFRIQFFRCQQARLPYDGISRPCGEGPVPSRQLSIRALADGSASIAQTWATVGLKWPCQEPEVETMDRAIEALRDCLYCRL